MSADGDGYALYERVVPCAEIRKLIEAVDASATDRSRAGIRHLLGCPPIAAVANDPRLLEIASMWLGASALPFKATLFDKNPRSNWLVAWHQDTALPVTRRTEREGWGPWSIKDGIQYAHAPASAKPRQRRVLHLEYAATLEIEPGFRLCVA